MKEVTIWKAFYESGAETAIKGASYDEDTARQIAQHCNGWVGKDTYELYDSFEDFLNEEELSTLEGDDALVSSALDKLTTEEAAALGFRKPKSSGVGHMDLFSERPKKYSPSSLETR